MAMNSREFCPVRLLGKVLLSTQNTQLIKEVKKNSAIANESLTEEIQVYLWMKIWMIN